MKRTIEIKSIYHSNINKLDRWWKKRMLHSFHFPFWKLNRTWTINCSFHNPCFDIVVTFNPNPLNILILWEVAQYRLHAHKSYIMWQIFPQGDFLSLVGIAEVSKGLPGEIKHSQRSLSFKLRRKILNSQHAFLALFRNAIYTSMAQKVGKLCEV